jgi:hypothetical protein
LSHAASTVRQACSSLFLKLMAKSDAGAPSLQRLVLQGLSTTWKSPEGDERHREPRPRTGSCEWVLSSSPGGLPEGLGALSAAHAAAGEEEGDVEERWEGREGRLLAYELVLGFLVEDHTLKMFKSDPKMAPGLSPCRCVRGCVFVCMCVCVCDVWRERSARARARERERERACVLLVRVSVCL